MLPRIQRLKQTPTQRLLLHFYSFTTEACISKKWMGMNRHDEGSEFDYDDGHDKNVKMELMMNDVELTIIYIMYCGRGRKGV